MPTTQAERDAVRNSGQVDVQKFDQEGRDQQNAETVSVEELATLYVALGGDDPRALAVVTAGQKAGNINADGEYIGGEGESTDAG